MSLKIKINQHFQSRNQLKISILRKKKYNLIIKKNKRNLISKYNQKTNNQILKKIESNPTLTYHQKINKQIIKKIESNLTFEYHQKTNNQIINPLIILLIEILYSPVMGLTQQPKDKIRGTKISFQNKIIKIKYLGKIKYPTNKTIKTSLKKS